MKEQTKRLISALLICFMLVVGLGTTCFAAGSGAGNASLASLEVSPGTLSPEFSADVYEYHVEVGADCDKLLVNAQTADGGAKMVIAGNSGLKVGTNLVIVNVTAADGTTTSKYTIHVVRGSGESQGAVQASTDAQGGESQSSPGLSGNIVGGAANLPGMGGSQTGGNESESSTAASQGTVTAASKTITLSEPEENEIPQGFRSVDLTVGDQTFKAWEFPSVYDTEGFYLIYGTDEAGKKAFYIYDKAAGTVITAPDGILSVGQDSVLSGNQMRSIQENYQKALKKRMMIIIGLSVLCFILLIAFTAAMTRRKHENEEEEPVREPASGSRDNHRHKAYRLQRYEEEEAGDDPDYGELYEDGEEPEEAGTYEDEEAGTCGEEPEYAGAYYVDEEEPEETGETGEGDGYDEIEDFDREEEVQPEPEDLFEEENPGERASEIVEEKENLPEEEAEEKASSQEEDGDLDADFDLLEALLSDSVRSSRPEDSNSIVDRAAKKAGWRAPEEAPVKEVKAKTENQRGRSARVLRPAQEAEPAVPGKEKVSQNLEEDDDFEFFDL